MPADRKPFIDAAIAVGCLILTVLFEFATAVLGNADKAKELHADPTKVEEFLAKPFDLWAIGFALIVGVALSGTVNARGRVLPPSIAAVITLLLIFFSLALYAVFPGSFFLFRIAVPDLFAVGFVAYTINRMKL